MDRKFRGRALPKLAGAERSVDIRQRRDPVNSLPVSMGVRDDGALARSL